MSNHPHHNSAHSLGLSYATIRSSAAYALLAVLGMSVFGCSTAPRVIDNPAAAASLHKVTVSRPADYRVATQAWGKLTWFVSADQNNCDSMTVGEATLKPGMESPRHTHPNCDEVLHVIQGTILHSLEDGKQVKMVAGDTVTIPMGLTHNAKNIGTDEAVMIISFSSAHRKVVNE